MPIYIANWTNPEAKEKAERVVRVYVISINHERQEAAFLWNKRCYFAPVDQLEWERWGRE